MVSGGSLARGVKLYYVGGQSMAQQTELGKKYGGIVIWELSEDAAPPTWLYGVIEEHFLPKRRW
jgi:hypothetical protein